MGYWSFAFFVLALLYLGYKHPSIMWRILPQWFQSSQSGEGVIEAAEVGRHTPEDQNPVQRSPPDWDRKENAEGTPKALPATTQAEIPTFSLMGQEDDEEGPRPMNVPTISVAAASSVQCASSMPPPPRPQKSNTPLFPAMNSAQRAGGVSTIPNPSPGQMAPPGRVETVKRAPVPSAAASLRLPSTGPLPNRGPLADSQQRANGGLAPNGAVSTPNARGKVLLAPGHSPMDWAALTRSGSISGVSTFQRVTPSQLRTMTGRKGKPAWSSWQGKVYNITPYLPFHPGGESELMKAAGRDGTKMFMDVHPWVNWENMMGSCLVGVLVPEDYARSELEDMD